MLRRYSVNFELVSIFLDAMSVFAALLLVDTAYAWGRDILLFLRQTGRIELPGLYYVIFPVTWVYLNLGISLYNGHINKHFADELYRLVISMLIAAISLGGLIYFVSLAFAQSLFMMFILITVTLMGVWRVAVRLYWRSQYFNKQELRRILIVGAGNTGRRVATHLLRPPESNLEVVGFLDDDPKKLAKDADVLGVVGDLEQVVDFYRINILLISLPASAFDKTTEIVDKLRMKPVKIWIVPDAHRLSLFQCDVVGQVCDIPLLDVRAPAISNNQRLVKRLFDLVVSSIIIIFALPIMFLIAVLIKLEDPGPIFFRQKRVGENTQPFEMIKFRTMVQNAEALRASVEKADQDGNILHKQRKDPRVTRLGGFLRRFSLDELPQIFNVFLGKMSLVGPRPEMPFLVEKYKSWQYVRFTIPQGMTGWWQVTGRSDKPMHLNTQDDLYYIRNYSLWLDIKIILKTFSTVILGRGAY